MSGLVQIGGVRPLANGARKTSKVMLLFPPEWVPTAPYLALPSLTAVLRQAGHHVIQRDVNIEMYDHFFQRLVPDLDQGPAEHAIETAGGEREDGCADRTGRGPAIGAGAGRNGGRVQSCRA